MDQLVNYRKEIADNGFTVIENVFSAGEIDAVTTLINKADQSNAIFRKTEDLFAIRRFLIEVPEVKQLIFNDRLKGLIAEIFGDQYFIVKSIYFD